MSTGSVLARGRRAAERLMVDSCKITRPDPDAEPGELDPDTMQYPEAARVTAYEGKCRVQVPSQLAEASGATAGERVTGVQTSELQLPIAGSEGVAPGDVVEILIATHDEALAGRKFTVTARHEKTHATARRLRVEEGTS